MSGETDPFASPGQPRTTPDPHPFIDGGHPKEDQVAGIPPDSAVEPGQTTTEWKVLLAGSAQLFVVATATLIAKAGFHASDSTVQAIAELEIGLISLGISYILSRGIRKAGTS